MTDLKHKINSGVQECHILVLGAQVLLGFHYRAVFEKGFEKLPSFSQYLLVGSLVMMLLAVGLLIGIVAYHQMADAGEDTEHLHQIITRLIGLALLPFAAAIGISLYIAAESVIGFQAAAIFGSVALATALFFWYGLEAVCCMNRMNAFVGDEPGKEEPSGDSPHSDRRQKISTVLEEIRVILPGAQALMGFQLASMLVEGFEKLPLSSRYVHLGSLSLMAVAIILLMTPASFHRLVDRGEHTEGFHRFAGRMLLAGMVPLALGLCGDLYIVTYKVTGSFAVALGLSLMMLAFFYGLWFGYTFYRRHMATTDRKNALSMTGQPHESG
ncbi:MAG: hypothetical protein KY468_00450 [Armatimonadetes bacterium]|nr:hypothetical protein [Armatimonadota bacterium]